MEGQALQYRVVTHFGAHLDELDDIRMTERWGRDQFPGVETRPLSLVPAGLRLTKEQAQKWLAAGSLLVGVGGPHVLFEEHGKGDGKSAATYAAEYFNIADDPALKPMLAYSLQADDKAEDQPFMEASLIKTMYSAGVPLEQVRAIHRVWFDSLYSLFEGHIVFTDQRATLRQIAIAWLVSEYNASEHRNLVYGTGTFGDAVATIDVSDGVVDELSELMRYLDRDFEKAGFSNFELYGLVRAMQAAGVSESRVMAIAATILKSKVVVQRLFLAARREFIAKARYVEACGSLRVAVIRSNNIEVHKAARRMDGKLDALVQFRIGGYVQIFSNQKHDLRPILARLRAAEYKKSGRKGELSRDQLYRGGTHPLVEAWYGFEKYGKIIGIFCGTLKTRHHRKTRLTEQEVVQCVADGAQHVHRARGVARDRAVDKSASDVASEALLELLAEDDELYEEQKQEQSIPFAE